VPHFLDSFFPDSKNLCKSGPRERSRWEANDTDGKAERPSERERASQSADENVSSCALAREGFRSSWLMPPKILRNFP
jgi:hypothetical protein